MPDDNVMRLGRVLISAQIAALLIAEFVYKSAGLVQKTAVDGVVL